MDSDGSTCSEDLASDTSSIVEWITVRDNITAQLQQEITAWLKTRVDASSLDIVAAYDELRRLDAKENLLLSKNNKRHEWHMYLPPEPAAMIIRETKWDVIRRAFEPRRQLLRSRALELSRSRLRPLKVTDLPLDVLHTIFHNFQDDALTEGQNWHCIVSWSHYEVTQSRRRRRTIHKLRLVSRLFYELATPLLFPVLRVQLTRSSLDLVERISKAPDIAAGVRGIQVSLGYRPKEYADSIARFKKVRLRVLHRFERSCHYRSEFCDDWVPGDLDGNSGGESVRRAIELRRAMNNYISLRDDWEEYVRITDRGEVFAEPLTEYQEIFQKGYAEYRRLQQEQQELLENGGFANALAAAVSQMPNVHCLNFVDEWDPNSCDPDHAETLNDNGLISRLISAPFCFRTIGDEPLEPEETVCKLECVRLLWELPIALHQAGVAVTQIGMSTLPVSTNFPIPFAQDHNGSPAWEDLAAACERLEFFDLKMIDNREINTTHLSDKDKSHLDNFIGSILSRCGQHLRILKLAFIGIGISTGSGGGFGESYHADSILSKIQELPRIRHVELRRLQLERKTLNAFCRNLGDDLGRLLLFRIAVQDGVWADAIDMLRNKMATDSEYGPWVTLRYLSGGEFGTDPTERSESEGPLAQAAARYVTGMLACNPLREGHSLEDV